jgi:cathepsin D
MVEGRPVEAVGLTETIFDTGTSLIVGDPEGIERFYAPLHVYGARSAPEYGDGTYTSTCASSTADQTPHSG